jgi:hypothetical protein
LWLAMGLLNHLRFYSYHRMKHPCLSDSKNLPSHTLPELVGLILVANLVGSGLYVDF